MLFIAIIIVNIIVGISQELKAKKLVDELSVLNRPTVQVIRLAKMKILIQNIYSLETLAHVDVLCLDKTGTITDGKLKVHSIVPMSDFTNGETDRLIKSYLAASDDNNAKFQAHGRIKRNFRQRSSLSAASYWKTPSETTQKRL